MYLTFSELKKSIKDILFRNIPTIEEWYKKNKCQIDIKVYNKIGYNTVNFSIIVRGLTEEYIYGNINQFLYEGDNESNLIIKTENEELEAKIHYSKIINKIKNSM